jgi:type IX secretion system PorP/SprF family membrane protein
MKQVKNICVLIMGCLLAEILTAQDPSFSQFFSSPLNINPALTGNINKKWRVISNYRNQWIGPANPYTTGTLSVDNKIFQNLTDNYVDENTRIGIGGMLMYDQAMAGVLKSNYASFNMSGNISLGNGSGADYDGRRIRHRSKIKMDQGAEHRLGIGIGFIYGHRRLDFSKLTFGEQFTGYGFNTNLPSGEAALSKMKPYLSASAGLLYTYKTETTNIDLGASAFHINKPRQTFLDDNKAYLAARYVVHGNLETMLTGQLILNTNAVYQVQSGASYFSVGGALGYYLPNDEQDVILNAGLWYWSNNAVIPYLGMGYGNIQFGLSYDITISQLNAAAQRANTFELSLILRGGAKPSGVIPAPWK